MVFLFFSSMLLKIIILFILTIFLIILCQAYYCMDFATSVLLSEGFVLFRALSCGLYYFQILYNVLSDIQFKYGLFLTQFYPNYFFIYLIKVLIFVFFLYVEVFVSNVNCFICENQFQFLFFVTCFIMGVICK